MPATREELITRWETQTGKVLAEEAFRAVRAPASSQPEPIQQLDAAFLQRLQLLPFAGEVAPQIDLRGLHLEGKPLSFDRRDLSGVRLDYAFPIGFIDNCLVEGAIFDHAVSVNGAFLRNDLHGISLVGASFRGGTFFQSNMSGANLEGARLELTKWRSANCSQVNLRNANLRFADLYKANLCGADLREAQLVEANLGEVVFDEQTQVQGADLRGSNLSDDLRAFAQQRGALLSDEQTNVVRELAELDALIQTLRENNSDGHLDAVIPVVEASRASFARNPDYETYEGVPEALRRAGLAQFVAEVEELSLEASKALVHFL